MPDNLTVLQKADLELADLITDGGYLVPAQAKQFIRHVIEQAVILKMVRVVPMRSPKQLIEGIHLPNRILRPGVSHQALPKSQRSKPETTKVELDAFLLKGQIDLDDETIEDCIEQGTFKSTVMQLMTDRIATDLDELIVNGDTTSLDDYLALMNGWLTATTTNVSNAGINPISDDILKDLVKVYPSEALRGRKNSLRFFTSVKAEIDYRHVLAQRGDGLGVATHQKWNPVNYAGIDIEPVDLFPENLGVGLNETNIILADPKQWAHGVWRKIKLESDRDITSGVTMIVATLRVDGKWEYEPHTAKSIHVKVA